MINDTATPSPDNMWTALNHQTSVLAFLIFREFQKKVDRPATTAILLASALLPKLNTNPASASLSGMQIVVNPAAAVADIV